MHGPSILLLFQVTVVNISKTLDPAQLRLIGEVNALATKAAKLTREEKVQIVHLIKTLASSSSFPLNSEKFWIRGRGKDCLAISRWAYEKYKKEYDEMKVRVWRHLTLCGVGFVTALGHHRLLYC